MYLWKVQEERQKVLQTQQAFKHPLLCLILCNAVIYLTSRLLSAPCNSIHLISLQVYMPWLRVHHVLCFTLFAITRRLYNGPQVQTWQAYVAEHLFVMFDSHCLIGST